jgi:hypothetical protein
VSSEIAAWLREQAKADIATAKAARDPRTEAARIAFDAAPVGVWEMRDRSCFWGLSDPRLLEAGLWAMRHLRRANDIFRAEFHVVDEPFAILWRYVRDEAGTLTDDQEEPVMQSLDELPPAHLLKAA